MTSCHDISDGGPLVAAVEMALSGSIGASLECIDWTGLTPEALSIPSVSSATAAGVAGQLFGEDQGHYLVTTSDRGGAELLRLAEQHSVPCWRLGVVGGEAISISYQDEQAGTLGKVSLADLRAAHEGFFPNLMGADAALA